jgi:hypothetical protein
VKVEVSSTAGSFEESHMLRSMWKVSLVNHGMNLGNHHVSLLVLVRIENMKSTKFVHYDYKKKTCETLG